MHFEHMAHKTQVITTGVTVTIVAMHSVIQVMYIEYSNLNLLYVSL